MLNPCFSVVLILLAPLSAHADLKNVSAVPVRLPTQINLVPAKQANQSRKSVTMRH
jgi:hypothetical protein